MKWERLLLVPFLLYLVVFLFWESQGFYPLEGDENAYLDIAGHILETGSLAPIGTHRIGLPLLLIPGLAFLGRTGAKLVLVGILGVLPVVGFRLVRPRFGRPVALVLSLLVFSGFPYLMAASQLFPDLPAGLLILFALERLQTLGRDEGWSWVSLVGLGLVLGYLPWLHLKFTGALLVLTGVYTVVGWDRMRRFRIRAWAPLLLVMLSLGLNGLYNVVFYEHWLGPWGISSLDNPFSGVLMHFLGLHWDQAVGLFWHQPLLIAGLVGLGVMARQTPLRGLIWVMLYLSVLVPNASHGDYGGLSLYGRFHWSVISLWLLPLGWAYRELRPRFAISLIVLGGILAYELYLARTLLINMRLYYRYWLPDSLFPAILWDFLPRFTDPTRLWEFVQHRPVFYLHAPNYVVVLFSCLCLGMGYVLGSRGRASTGSSRGSHDRT